MKTALLSRLLLAAALVGAPAAAQEGARMWSGRVEGSAEPLPVTATDVEGLRRAFAELRLEWAALRDRAACRARVSALWRDLNDTRAPAERAARYAVFAAERAALLLEQGRLEEARAACAQFLLAAADAPPGTALVPATAEGRAAAAEAARSPALAALRQQIEHRLQDLAASEEPADDRAPARFHEQLAADRLAFLEQQFGLPTPAMDAEVARMIRDQNDKGLGNLGLRAAPSLAARVLAELDDPAVEHLFDPLEVLFGIDPAGTVALMDEFLDRAPETWRLQVLELLTGFRAPSDPLPRIAPLAAKLLRDERYGARAFPLAARLAAWDALDQDAAAATAALLLGLPADEAARRLTGLELPGAEGVALRLLEPDAPDAVRATAARLLAGGVPARLPRAARALLIGAARADAATANALLRAELPPEERLALVEALLESPEADVRRVLDARLSGQWDWLRDGEAGRLALTARLADPADPLVVDRRRGGRLALIQQVVQTPAAFRWAAELALATGDTALIQQLLGFPAEVSLPGLAALPVGHRLRIVSALIAGGQSPDRAIAAGLGSLDPAALPALREAAAATEDPAALAIAARVAVGLGAPGAEEEVLGLLADTAARGAALDAVTRETLADAVFDDPARQAAFLGRALELPAERGLVVLGSSRALTRCRNAPQAGALGLAVLERCRSLGGERSGFLAAAALELIGPRGDAEGLALLRRAVEEPVGPAATHAAQQRAATLALASLGSREAALALAEASARIEDSAVRQEVLAALRRMREHQEELAYWRRLDAPEPAATADPVAELLVLLRDEDVEVRAAAAQVLGAFPRIEAAPALIRLLRDPDEGVRDAARAVLDRITAANGASAEAPGAAAPADTLRGRIPF